MTGGEPAADPRTELVAPVRVALTVSGAAPGTRLQAVARIQRRDGPGWNPRAPVVLPDSGQAEFDLSEVPPGDHEMSLIAWAPDASAKPVSVRLPRLTIRPACLLSRHPVATQGPSIAPRPRTQFPNPRPHPAPARRPVPPPRPGSIGTKGRLEAAWCGFPPGEHEAASRRRWAVPRGPVSL